MTFIPVLRRLVLAAAAVLACGALQAFPPSLSDGPPKAGVLRKVTVMTQRGGRTFVTLDGNAKATRDQTQGASLNNAYLNGTYWGGTLDTWNLPMNYAGNVTLKTIGRFGGIICKTLKASDVPNPSPSLLSVTLPVKESAIGGLDKHAETLHPNLKCDDDALVENGIGVLPVICPRVLEAKELYDHPEPPADANPYGLSPGLAVTFKNPASSAMVKAATYEGYLDSKNNPPDDRVAKNSDIHSHFDCKNVLAITNVTTSYDWEDDALLQGVDKNNPNQRYPEDTGGAYANFHYAVMPCDDAFDDQYAKIVHYTNSAGASPTAIAELMRCANDADGCPSQNAYRAVQYLLHLGADGTGDTEDNGLAAIGKEEERPALKRHSLLPGAFWTKNEDNYDQCEWLDTSGMATAQSVNYQNFGIWDWDDRPDACAAVILWEGDGASTDLFRQLHVIGETDLADDFIGYFKVTRNETDGEIVVKRNLTGDLGVTFTTGDTKCRH